MNSKDEVKSEEKSCCGHGCGRFWKWPFLVAVIVLGKSVLVLLLWNALVPEVFHGPVLNFKHALLLTVLAKLLVGFGVCKYWGGRHGHLWKARWAAMSPEEREKLREDIRKRCGC